MCTGLLGWFSIEAYIDMRKLMFFGSLCYLDKNCMSYEIFFTRIFMSDMGSDMYSYGFTSDILIILKKYNLYKFLQDYLSK